MVLIFNRSFNTDRWLINFRFYHILSDRTENRQTGLPNNLCQISIQLLKQKWSIFQKGELGIVAWLVVFSVIVSQWVTLLNVVEQQLRERGVSMTRITGEVPVAQRQERVERFNRPSSGPRVMLLSLTAGGVGLNLIGGNHLFLLDLHWYACHWRTAEFWTLLSYIRSFRNPALEKQACDRIYRMGQTKDVYVHK